MAFLDLVAGMAGSFVNAFQMGGGQRIVPPKVTVVTEGGPPSGAAVDWARRVVNRVRQATLLGSLRWPKWTDPVSGDPQAMFDAYQAMTADPMAWRALTTLVDSVASLDLAITAPDKNDARQQTVVAFHKEAMNRAGGKLALVRKVFLPGVMRGYSISEKSYPTIPDGEFAGKWGFRWKSIDPPPGRTPFILDQHRNIVGVLLLTDNGSEILSPQDFVIYSYLPLFEDPHGNGAYARAHSDWWQKTAGVQLWALNLERWGAPAVKGTYTEEGAQKAALEKALEDFGANKWLTVPQGAAVEAMVAATSGAADWEAFVARADKGMLVAIYGSHLPFLEGQNANVAGNSETQRGTAELVQWALAEEAGKLFTEEGRVLTQMNYAGVPTPVYTFGAVNQTEIGLMLDNATKLKSLGGDLSDAELHERSGFSQPVDEEDTLGGNRRRRHRRSAIHSQLPAAWAGFGWSERGSGPRRTIRANLVSADKRSEVFRSSAYR
jgi:hypothetical protein